MSIIDKIAAKVMSPESEEDRQNARTVAMALTNEGDWLGLIVAHHRQIEAAFAAALAAAGRDNRQAALKELGILLTGHANAEESVIYPAVADGGEQGHAAEAYEEQAMTKIEMAKLEKLDPDSEAWGEKLRDIRGAVLHHVYEEEGTWFPRLQQTVPPSDREQLTQRYIEEFERYVSPSAVAF